MKNVHIIPHSHWDREWYMPFEYHRYRLIDLIDGCMELFENEEEYSHFHLDGHTLLVEDYLEIKPENREKIQQYIREGKFAVGPWYVLQDEFLTSSEANIRNLCVGMDLAEALGGCCKVGYFPDAFGNAGQMPQILHQAGMKAIVFGRGVKSIGVNNSLLSESQFDSSFSELYWQSPDGSRLPGILFANWYNNGAEIPTDNVKEYWDGRIADMEKYASTSELLLMNGCDHQPVQKNLTEAIKAAKKAYPDYRFIQSDFETYADSVIQKMPTDASVVKGELTSQETDGWCTLTNTASANVDLKIQNRKGERVLESVAEPLMAIAQKAGMKPPKEMLLYSWKMLMKNHPHDSICGCSCDEVNDEIEMRFSKSRQAAEMIVQDSLNYLSEHMEVSEFKNHAAVLSVINTYGREKTAVVKVQVDVKRKYGANTLSQSAKETAEGMYLGSYKLVDEQGIEIPCATSAPQICFGYDLPEDVFRKPYMAERITVTFEAEKIPAMGYKNYALYPTEDTVVKESLITEKNCMENENLRVQICEDGTLTICDKHSGRSFEKVLSYEDVADLGNEYTFVPSPEDIPICSSEGETTIEMVCDEPFLATYRIRTLMMMPKEAEDQHRIEQQMFVDVKSRTAKRSREMVPMEISTFVSLEKSGKGVQVRSVVKNTAKDHRLRVLIPTEMHCETHKAESVFEVVERKNEHHAGWTYPSGCDRQQGFVMMQDDRSGIAAANTGLYEYEILKDRTIAITLFRAVGELGDWGVFPTKRSQCLKEMEFEFEILPFTKESDALVEAAAFQHPMQCVQNLKSEKNENREDNKEDNKEHQNRYENGMFAWAGDYLRLTAWKPAFQSDDVIMRWVNYSDQEQILEIQKTEWMKQLYQSDVTEKKGCLLTSDGDTWKIHVKPYEILTLGCEA